MKKELKNGKIVWWPRSQVAKALLCKRSIRRCKSDRGLKTCRGGGIAIHEGLKILWKFISVRVGVPPPAQVKSPRFKARAFYSSIVSFLESQHKLFLLRSSLPLDN